MTSLPLPTLDSSKQEALNELLLDLRSNTNIPAACYAITTAKGTIYEFAAGDRIHGEPDNGQVTMDTPFQLFSNTKIVTSCACMQLVDQGLVSLDSVEDMERILPELEKIQVLVDEKNGEFHMEKPHRKITLRMLLTHTSGFAYPNYHPLLSKWVAKHPIPIMLSSDGSIESITHPLAFEPGTSYFYGEGFDWAGLVVMRLSGLTLDEYFKRNIFLKLDGGAPSLSFYPPKNYSEVLMRPCARKEDGSLVEGPWNSLGRELDPAKISQFHMGGGGLIGSNRDFLAFLRGIMRCAPNSPGTGTGTGQPLMSTAAYEEFFKDSLPPIGTDNGCKAGMKRLMEGELWFQPQPALTDLGQSIALGLNFKQLDSGRKAGSGNWSGAARTQFWIDPTTGIAGICSTQLFESPATLWHNHFRDFESAVYKSLSTS